MSLFTSSQFASATASGTDWRDTAKAVIEKLEAAKTDGQVFNLGFLYISDHLSDDAESILNLFKSVLGIEDWVGANGVGVCGCGEAFINKPAISAMIGFFPEGSYCVFPAFHGLGQEAKASLEPWLEKNSPMLGLVHGDPLSEEDPAQNLRKLNTVTQGFLIGGLSSSRKEQVQFASGRQKGGVSGVLFAQDIPVATTLSQGCEPIGKAHTITMGSENVIRELNNQKAVSVFEADLREMAIQKIGKDPDDIVIDRYEIETKEDLIAVAPKEFQSVMKGEMHVAFPISDSDQQDYLVRNIMGLDQDEGSIAVSQYISTGETMLFVHRDDNTVREDLSKRLNDLKVRVESDTGRFEPKGAIYISCAARASSLVQDDDFSEIGMVHDIIGDIPLAGFYAGGEISNARLYGYTGILTLFL